MYTAHHQSLFVHTSSFVDELAMLEGVISQSPEILVFSCSECQYAFTARDVLQKHMKRIHNDIYCQVLKNGQIPSVACQQISTSATKQKQGESEEPRSNIHQRLTKTASQQEVVKTHQLTYTGKKTHVCMLCDKGFCRLGTQSYKQLNILNRHQHLHAGERPFHFKHCDKSLSQSSNLKKLQKVHNGGKPSRSKRRDKTFSRKGDMMTRRHVHTGERPFLCKHCDKSFSQLGNLKIHQRIHTGDKPYHCKLCDKTFSQLGNLSAHQRLHNREKPFACKQCDRTFSQLGNLQTHQRLHTGEKPFACKHCAKSFNQLGQLKAHRRMHSATVSTKGC